eukprot:5528948-Prymnesium_polylepis.1
MVALIRWVSPASRNRHARLRANEREMRLSLTITTPPELEIALPSLQAVEFSMKLSLASVNVPLST